jgi:hypothetical protein
MLVSPSSLEIEHILQEVKWGNTQHVNIIKQIDSFMLHMESEITPLTISLVTHTHTHTCIHPVFESYFLITFYTRMILQLQCDYF